MTKKIHGRWVGDSVNVSSADSIHAGGLEMYQFPSSMTKLKDELKREEESSGAHPVDAEAHMSSMSQSLNTSMDPSLGLDDMPSLPALEDRPGPGNDDGSEVEMDEALFDNISLQVNVGQ